MIYLFGPMRRREPGAWPPGKPNYSILCLLPVVFLIVGLTSCGKTGDPRPRENSRSFVWQEITVRPVFGCLDIYGRISGVYANLDAVELELSALSGDQDCAGCPFLPEEKIPLRQLREIFDASRGELRFVHCPALPAPAYRLRLAGINVFDASRRALSPEAIVRMP